MAICLHIPLFSGIGDSSQLPLTCEFLVKHFELVDELLTDGSEDVSRGDNSISLNSYEQLGNVWVSN